MSREPRNRIGRREGSATTLQTYIFHLRSSLAVDTPRERVASEFLRTRHSGYQLECHTDVEEFRRLARAGREAAEAGDPQAVSELLGRALDLWRGPVKKIFNYSERSWHHCPGTRIVVSIQAPAGAEGVYAPLWPLRKSLPRSKLHY